MNGFEQRFRALCYSGILFKHFIVFHLIIGEFFNKKLLNYKSILDFDQLLFLCIIIKGV